MASSLVSVVHRFMQDNADGEPDDASNTNGAVVVDGDEGKWILFSIAILMSWCFLAVALAMGYYSWRESRLLGIYQNEGVVISGQVSNIVLLREGSRSNIIATKKKPKTLKTIVEERSDGDTASLSDDSVRSDVPYSQSSIYLVAIKYGVEISPGYSTFVVKWLRLPGDVLPRSIFYRKKSTLVGMTVLFNLTQTPTQQEQLTSNPDSDTSLPLVLIKSMPLSAHPQSAIVKSQSLSSRSVTISIIAFFAIFGALAHCLALHIAYATNLEDGLASMNIFSPFAMVSLLGIIVLFLFVEAIILDKPIGGMLEKEYTNRGEFAAVESGQTNEYTIDTLEMACRTFSSRSDAFLSMGNRALLQNANSSSMASIQKLCSSTRSSIVLS
eukprot:scaffold83136_cov74-Cyclotella_meneghiniana.AAC.4